MTHIRAFVWLSKSCNQWGLPIISGLLGS